MLHGCKRIVIAIAALALAPSVAQADVVTISFAGKLASAENIVFDDPDLPSSDFFKVGQSFSGLLTYDTSAPEELIDDTLVTLPLTGFDIVIGGVDFSDRFIPRLIGRPMDGNIEFVSGGASQGGGASLAVNLGMFSNLYPTAAQLNGKTGLFSYADYQPLGGIVSGQAVFGAVPEPASWALMIVGVGAIGGVMRRRRERAVVAYA